MRKPVHAVDVFLQPGEVYFGGRDTRIRTLLGSCVAIVMWHPGMRAGGMCHYMLPGAPARRQVALDGRYADDAMALMLREIQKTDTAPADYQVKLFGGGNMFAAHRSAREGHVGAKNVEVARTLLKQHGFSSCAEHLGGVGHRTVLFDIWSGHVWMKHQPPVAVDSKNEMPCLP